MAKKLFATTFVGGTNYDIVINTRENYSIDRYEISLEDNYLVATDQRLHKFSVPLVRSSFMKRSVENGMRELLLSMNIDGNIDTFYIRRFCDYYATELEALGKVNNIPVEQSPEEAKAEAVGALLGVGLGLAVMGISALAEHSSNRKNRR